MSVSVVLHIFIVLVLTNTTDKSIKNLQKKSKTTPIRSYIYYKPIKSKKDTVIIKNDLKQEIEEVSSLEQLPPSLEKNVEQKKTSSQSDIQKSISSIPTKKVAPALKIATNKSLQKYSRLQSLSRLRERIDNQIINQNIYNNTKPNTGSVMHGTPRYVPHSSVEDTQKKSIASKPSQVGNGFSILKDDNGSCTLTEDLSMVGLQGKTTSKFGCGLTKDEKAFQNHMKNVLKKLGK